MAALLLSERERFTQNAGYSYPVAASAEFHSEKYTYANLVINNKSGFYLIMTPSHFTLDNISERKKYRACFTDPVCLNNHKFF